MGEMTELISDIIQSTEDTLRLISGGSPGQSVEVAVETVHAVENILDIVAGLACARGRDLAFRRPPLTVRRPGTRRRLPITRSPARGSLCLKRRRVLLHPTRLSPMARRPVSVSSLHLTSRRPC